MATATALRPMLVPVMLVLALFASLRPMEIVLLAEEVTESGKELAGKIGSIDWKAILEKAGDGKIRRIDITVKDGDREERFSVDYDTRTPPKPPNRVFKSLLDYVNHNHGTR